MDPTQSLTVSNKLRALPLAVAKAHFSCTLLLQPMSFSPENICTLQYLITEETYCALGLFLSSVEKDSLLSERKDSREWKRT